MIPRSSISGASWAGCSSPATRCISPVSYTHLTPFPEVLHRCPHMAYKVDSLEKYIADADSVICGPMQANDQGDQLAFVWKDGAILELYQPK